MYQQITNKIWRRNFIQNIFLGTASLPLLVGTQTIALGSEDEFPFHEITIPLFPNKTFNILDFGAKKDGNSMNTEAFSLAINACVKAGGGRVVVPNGTWLTGPIHLRSNVELHLEEGAIIQFSRRYEDYLPVVLIQRGGVHCFNYSPPIYANECTNIAITGSGVIDGNGEVWWPWKKSQPGMKRLFEYGKLGVPFNERVFGTEEDGVRPPFVQPIHCRNVLIEGVTFKNGPSWNIHPVWCKNVTIRNISVIAHGPNNDGIDPDGCKNVLIEHCFLDTGDDAICLKAGRDEEAWRFGKPCENVLIRYCEVRKGHGAVTIGSEMSAGVKNVLAHDCHFDGTNTGIRIKSKLGRGGVVENIRVKDIEMGTMVKNAIDITGFYGGEPFERDEDYQTQFKAEGHAPVFRDFSISNITCKKARQSILIRGLPNSPIRDVMIQNVRLEAEKGAYISRAKSLEINQATIYSQQDPVMHFSQCQDITIGNSKSGPENQIFVEVSGEKTNNIRLLDNQIHEDQELFKLHDHVSKKEIKY